MDRDRMSDLAHADHPVAAPLDDVSVDELLRRVVPGSRSVLDLGCGDGTWLLRALRTDPDVHAVGVDLSGLGFGRVRDRARREGTAERLSLTVGDAAAWPVSTRHDVVLCVGSTHAFGDLSATLLAAGEHLAPGGRLVVGECFWESDPGVATLDALGAAPDDYGDLTGTVATATSAGWLPVAAHVSSLAEWDAYEWAWTGSLTRWALEHPDDPDAEAVLERATAHRDAWLTGYRGVLGFVTLVLARRT